MASTVPKNDVAGGKQNKSGGGGNKNKSVFGANAPGTAYEKGSQKVSPETFNLDLKHLAAVQIPGASDLLGLGPTTVMDVATGRAKIFTADETFNQFTKMPAAQRAQIEYKMFLAGGYYPANYQPKLGGPLTTQDMAAFRQFLIGFAANPKQGKINDMLDQAAKLGQEQGVPKHAPIDTPITLTNPDDLKAALQTGASAIFGKFLDPAQVDRFVASYQQQETAYQQAKYRAAGYDPTTGQPIETPTGDLDVQHPTLVAPVKDQGAISEQFFGQMAQAHPTETKTSIFQDKLGEILQGLVGNPIGIQP